MPSSTASFHGQRSTRTATGRDSSQRVHRGFQAETLLLKTVASPQHVHSTVYSVFNQHRGPALLDGHTKYRYIHMDFAMFSSRSRSSWLNNPHGLSAMLAGSHVAQPIGGWFTGKLGQGEPCAYKRPRSLMV